MQVKEVEAAAERAAAQSAAIIEEAMAQAEETRRRAEQDTQSQVWISWISWGIRAAMASHSVHCQSNTLSVSAASEN